MVTDAVAFEEVSLRGLRWGLGTEGSAALHVGWRVLVAYVEAAPPGHDLVLHSTKACQNFLVSSLFSRVRAEVRGPEGTQHLFEQGASVSPAGAGTGLQFRGLGDK